MGEIAVHGVQLAADGKIPRHVLNPPALGQIKIRDVEPVEADIVLRVDKRRAHRREDHVICVVSGHQRGQRVRLIVARRQLVIEGNIRQLLHRLIAAGNSVIECLTDLFLGDELLRPCIRAREDCEFISAVGQSLGKPQRLGRLRHGNRGGIGRRGCGIGGGRLPAVGCERRRERCDKVYHRRGIVIPDDLTKPYFDRLGTEFSFNNMEIPGGTSMPYFHCHEVWEVNLYQKGRKNCIIDGRLYELSPWDILLIPPGAVHRSFSPTNDPHRRTLMYINESYFSRYRDIIDKKGLLANLQRPHLRPPAAMRLPLARLMERITSMDVNELGDPVKNALMQGFLFEFLVMLGSFPEAGTAITENEAAVRAITLLTETDDSISAIATACGFSSPNYFKDVFRRVIGMPPTEYRRRALPALEETLLEEW